MRESASARELAEGRRKTWQEKGQYIPAEQSQAERLMYQTHGLAVSWES